MTHSEGGGLSSEQGWTHPQGTDTFLLRRTRREACVVVELGRHWCVRYKGADARVSRPSV
ncbi:unnamed protein product [Ectocarpus sp. CCAP 1310/34]|nr:unnamed protein product [Ectocarpus sp. CCAP 1310/34]